MSEATQAVFLSYASQDAEAAKRICEALREAGVEVWFDQNELVGGDQWDGKIRGQISSCALFVPVISNNTQARLEGYFRIEWKLAARRTHAMASAKAFLLPIVIDDTHDASAHVPDEFREVQWTRLPGGETSTAFVTRVKKLLDGTVAGVADPGLPGSTSPATAPVVSPVDPARQTRRKMTPLRQRIAQRLIAAQHEAAMLTTFNEADMSAVIALRTKYQEEFTKRHGVKLGFMAFFVKAVVCALKEVPAVNTQIDGDIIVENHFFDIGVAVSTEKGLMVPVIRDCDLLSLGEVEISLAATAKKAREGKITLSDLDGGVFTITNGGVFGSLLSTPIINSPQCAILGMHAIQERPVVRDGQIVIRPMMYLALSYDHRLVDGREAVTFLVKVKQAIEDPTRLMLSV